MKLGRLLLIIVGVIFLLGALAFGLALTPAVQRWAVLRATRDVPGLKLEIGGISAGFSGVKIQGLHAEKDHVIIKADQAEADFSPWGFLFSKRLDLSRVAVTGLDVDASHLAPTQAGAAAAGAPTAAPGLLARVQLPFDLTLGEANIAGHARVPGAAGQPPIEADFTVTGGKIAPGQEGLIQLNATLRDPAKGATVTSLRVQAGLRATLTAQRTFSKVSLTTLVDADGPALPGQSQLKIAADLFQSSGGENYEVTIDTLLRGATENLLKLHAQLPAASAQYAGDWELKARTAQVEPFSFGVKLPDFDVKGSGRFAFDPAKSNSSLQGTVQGQLNRLESLNPDWKAFGTVKIDATFDGSQEENVLNLKRLTMIVAGAQPVLEIQTIAPVSYDLAKNQLVATGAGSSDLAQVKLAGLPIDWVKPFVKAVELSGSVVTGQFTVARVSTSATAASVRGQAQIADLSVSQNGAPLLQSAAVTVRTEATLTDNLLTIPVLEIGLKTAQGDVVNLTGKLSTKTDANPPVDFGVRFTASSPKLLAHWLPGATVSAQGEVNGSLRDEALLLESLKLKVQQGNQALANVTALQAFAANLTTHALVPKDATKPVAKVELGKLPLGLLPVTGPDAVLGGSIQPSEFEASVDSGKIVVRSLAPVRLTDVSLTQNRQLALNGIAVELSPLFEYAGPDAFHFQTGELTLRNASKAALVTMKIDAAKAATQPMQANITFAVEVPVLAAQPIFADAQAVSAGRATGEIRAVVDDHQQVEGRLTLNGLIAADSGKTLPVANIGFRAVVQERGVMSIQAPILLDNAGRRSDLNLAFELSPLGKGRSVDGKLTGSQVELEDLLSVLGVFSASAAPAETQNAAIPTASTTPDTTAAWSGFSGQLVLDVKSVTRGQEWVMTGLSGLITIEPTRLALQKLEASFSETSRLSARLEMRFNGGAMPYRLTGDYSLNDFDTGKFFKAFDPGKPPTIDGLFNVFAKFSGNGETVSRALERVHGEFQLTSKKGAFRGLARASNKLSMTSKAVELGASVLGSLFGSDKGTKTAEKVAGQAYFVDQLAQSLGELNYDLLSVKLARDESLNMNLEEIGLVSPELRLTGRGDVTYVAGKSLLEQPLNASLMLAARGKTEELLGKVRVLDGTKDELGYAKAKEPITLGGSLGKPDATAFFTKIATAKLSEYLESGNGNGNGSTNGNGNGSGN